MMILQVTSPVYMKHMNTTRDASTTPSIALIVVRG